MFTYVCTYFTVPVTAGRLWLMSVFAPSTWCCAMILFDSKSEIRKPGPLLEASATCSVDEGKNVCCIPAVAILRLVTARRVLELARLPVPGLPGALAESAKTKNR